MSVTSWPQYEIAIDLLDGQDANPNEMSDDEFSLLVESVAENGWLVPIQVVGPDDDGRFVILGGHHRVKAGLVLGAEKIPAIVIDPDEYDQDRREIELVRLNTLHGGLNPEKFTALFNRLTEKYDADMLRRMMAFTKQDAFQKVYLDARNALPPELADKLDEVRDELKTVDDLSLVLNRLFTDYGTTLDSNFMFFSWGGREHLMVQLKQPSAWHRVKAFAKWCQEEHVEMDQEIMTRMTWPV